MKIKRFVAPDMRQAIRMVRNEQGPDAVILSSRGVEAGIEIISAVDFDQELIAEMIEAPGEGPDGGLAPQASVPSDSGAVGGPDLAYLDKAETAVEDRASLRGGDDFDDRISRADDLSLIHMQQELSAMKVLLQDQVSRLTEEDYARRQPLKAAHIRRLRDMGVGEYLAQEIVMGTREGRHPDKAWREVLLGIARRIPIVKEGLQDEGGVVALIGPTGVGKTTTLAKLAARYALRHGAERIAMVTMDTYRIGAHRQLQTYGQILGIPVLEAGAEDMARVLEGLEDKNMVLVDTSGMGHRDRRLRHQLVALTLSPKVSTYLTLAANAQEGVIDEVVEAFAIGNPVGCVLTKLDETVNLGEALTAIVHHRLPLAYVTTGQRVPEDLKLARVSDLVSRMIALGNRHRRSIADAPRGQVPVTAVEVAANAHV